MLENYKVKSKLTKFQLSHYKNIIQTLKDKIDEKDEYITSLESQR
jgi:hypothetical protein